MVPFYGVVASYIVSVSANLSAQRLVGLEEGTEVSPAWLYDVRGIDAARYPDVAASRHELSELSTDEVYTTGIEVLLDSVEAIASQRAGKGTGARGSR